MAVTDNVQPKSGRIVYAVSDFLHPFQFHFSKEGMDRIVQNRPGSDLDGLVKHIRKQAGVQESSGPVSGRTQPPRYQFSHLQTQFSSSRDAPDNIVQNQPGSDLILADSVGFGQTDLVRKQANVQESPGPLLVICFPADSDQMRIRSGMFTGNTLFRIQISP